VRILKVIERRIRHKGDGIDLASDVSGVIAMNIGEGSSVARSSSHSVIRQVNGRSRKGPAKRKAGERLSDGSATGADATPDEQSTQRNN
jgi:hypothetical protein